jgi:opacity protein-like surface antigen
MDFRIPAGVLAFGVLACSSVQSAGSNGFYFGVSVGQADFNAKSSEVAPVGVPLLGPPVTGTIGLLSPVPNVAVFGNRFVAAGSGVFAAVEAPDVEFDHVDTSLTATVGYRVNSYFAAEVSYVDLGTVRSELTLVPVFTPFPLPPAPASQAAGVMAIPSIHQSTEIDVTGVSVALLGSWPITDRWSVLARAGYFFADAEVERRISQSMVPPSSFNSSGTTYGADNAVVGAGVDYAFTTHWTVRLEYQHYLETGGRAFNDEPSIDTVSLGVVFRL